jgi:competence protein ComEA
MFRAIKSVMAVLAMLVTGYAFAGTVNINTADADTLAAELAGVGPSRALAIVQYRENVGRIGPRILEWNEGRIVVAPQGDSD